MSSNRPVNGTSLTEFIKKGVLHYEYNLLKGKGDIARLGCLSWPYCFGTAMMSK